MLSDADGVRTHRPSLERRPQLSVSRRGSFDLLLNPWPSRTNLVPQAFHGVAPASRFERTTSVRHSEQPEAPSRSLKAGMGRCGLRNPQTSVPHTQVVSTVTRRVFHPLRVDYPTDHLGPARAALPSLPQRHSSWCTKGMWTDRGPQQPSCPQPGTRGGGARNTLGKCATALHDKLRHVMTGLRNAAGPPGRQSEGPQLSAALARSVCELTSI